MKKQSDSTKEWAKKIGALLLAIIVFILIVNNFWYVHDVQMWCIGGTSPLTIPLIVLGVIICIAEFFLIKEN